MYVYIFHTGNAINTCPSIKVKSVQIDKTLLHELTDSDSDSVQ